MLSYRHGFHAGNHADVLKHLVLMLVLRHLGAKDKGYRFVDTHAGAGGYWNSAGPNGFPEWVQVAFNGQKAVTEIDVFSVQDAYTAPVEPTPGMTFSSYGIMDFEVLYWTGSAWARVPGGLITGNRQVWRRLSFPALTTDHIVINVLRTGDGWSRIVELEAWGN